MGLSKRKDRVMLGDLVLAQVVLAGQFGADTETIHDAVEKSAQREDVNVFRTSRILIGLQKRGLVDRTMGKQWYATSDGNDRAESWHPES